MERKLHAPPIAAVITPTKPTAGSKTRRRPCRSERNPPIQLETAQVTEVPEISSAACQPARLNSGTMSGKIKPMLKRLRPTQPQNKVSSVRTVSS